MKSYLTFSRSKSNYSIKHSFGLIYGKIETVLFGFLCVILLITSKVNPTFSKNTSFAFISLSLPVVKVVSFPFNSAINLLTDFNELVEAKKKNKELKEEVEKLKTFYISALNIYQENLRLKDIINFVSTKSSGFKVSKIVGKTNQTFNQKLFLDVGKNREIKEGSLVSGSIAAVGRVLEVGDNKSTVMMITDSSSRIPVIDSRTSVRSILAGTGGNLMEMLYLPENHGAKEGDMIFTSGDGDTLPPAVLVGIVVKVSGDYVGVAMAEDPNKINFVSIIDY